MRRIVLATLFVTAALSLVACSGAPSEVRTPSGTSSGTSSGSDNLAALRVVGTPTVLASGLHAPWSILRLGEGNDSTLVSERDSGIIRELTPAGTLRTAGTVAGVVHRGEGGLLGLASHTSGTNRFVYAYLTTAIDNRIVRMPLIGTSGNYRLGETTPILTGLAKAANHDGGRLAFGPDEMLYATVGDAGVPGRAQDATSLNGKILRMTATGEVPTDNPTAGSLVYSLGHRNPQGLTWDSSGQLYAAEFGQDTWDELNRIEPGGNYGWPTVEGAAERPGFIDPLVEWPTDDASPSGLAFVDGEFFLAALKGQRLWSVSLGEPIVTLPLLTREYGRIRDVAAGPHGTLWVLTNNTDGRGSPASDDDRLLQVTLTDSGQR